MYDLKSYDLEQNYNKAAILAAILNSESCSRVRIPHPPGNVSWDPIER